MGVSIRGLSLIGLAILIFVLCLNFLHFEFLSSGLWWTLFCLMGLSTFISVFGRHGQGTLSPTINLIGNIAGFIIDIISFIFFWWQGGVAMIVAFLLWTMFVVPVSSLIHGLIRLR